MSLKGSLETVGLTDVLTLLAMTKKTGELQVTGARGDGRLWVDDGQLIGSSAGRGPSHVDAIFELLRVKVGTFSFEDGEAPMAPSPATDIEPLLTEAAARLSQWDDIEASIPSLFYTVAMALVAPTEEVLVRADQWRLLAAAGSGTQVSAVLDVMEFGEFDGCQALKELADANLITVEEPAPVAVPADVFQAVPEPADEPLPPSGDVDLSPIGVAGDPRLAPIHSASDDSGGYSDFGRLLPDPGAALEGLDLSSLSGSSGIDAHPFEAGFGEMADPESDQPDDGYQPVQPIEGDSGYHFEPDHGFEGDQGYQPDRRFESDRRTGPDDAPLDRDADQPAQAWVIAESSQVYQPDPAPQGDPSPLGYQAGHGYQPYPAADGEQAPGYQVGEGDEAQPTDAGYPPTSGYQTYQGDHGNEAGPADSEDAAGVGEPAVPTDAADSEAVEGSAGPDGDAKVNPTDEPINRGLLLKFLSSVRT